MQAGSFTRAAQQLGVTKSALSQTVRNLESRLNMRLLNRTTRSLSPTPEGLAILQQIRPHFHAIQEQIRLLDNQRDSAVGKVRINASLLAVNLILLPKLQPLLAENPQIQLEIQVEDRWVDIVKEGFDMGVRLGDALNPNMIAVKISQPLRTAVVATPEYLQGKSVVQQIEELDGHHTVATRLANDHARLMAWDFRQNGKLRQYVPKAQTILNVPVKQAVLNHLGIGFVIKADVENELRQGTLVELLGDYATEYEPFYLYYPNRKHHSKVFQLVAEALKSG